MLAFGNFVFTCLALVFQFLFQCSGKSVSKKHLLNRESGLVTSLVYIESFPSSNMYKKEIH